MDNSPALLRQTRRHFFRDCGIGVGAMALGSLLRPDSAATASTLSLAGPLDAWLVAPWFERAVRLSICLVAGTVVYFGVLWATGLRYLELRAPA